MTAADLVTRARSAGVALTLGANGKMKVTGDPAAVHRLLPDIRAHKADLMALLSDAQDPAQRHRRWCLTLPSGEVLDVTSTPPGTRAEVLAGHPAGTLAEPWEDPDQGPTPPALTRGEEVHPAPEPDPTPPTVTCGTCARFELDPIGSRAGIGRCSIDSRWRPAVCWPGATHHCRDHQGSAE